MPFLNSTRQGDFSDIFTDFFRAVFPFQLECTIIVRWFDY